MVGDVELDALVALGRWAHEALAIWAKTGGAARLTAAWTRRGAAVAWHDADGVCGAVCDDANTISRLLARHARISGA